MTGILELQREIHEGGCDAPCDKIGVRRLAAQNNSERKNGIDLLLHRDELHRQWDLKRARNPHQMRHPRQVRFRLARTWRNLTRACT